MAQEKSLAQVATFLAHTNEPEGRCQLGVLIVKADKLHFSMHSQAEVTGPTEAHFGVRNTPDRSQSVRKLFLTISHNSAKDLTQWPFSTRRRKEELRGRMDGFYLHGTEQCGIFHRKLTQRSRCNCVPTQLVYVVYPLRQLSALNGKDCFKVGRVFPFCFLGPHDVRQQIRRWRIC